MAKKMNSLAKDLAGISNGADSRVLALLNETKKQTTAPSSPQKPKAEKAGIDNNEEQSRQAKETRVNRSKPPRARQVVDWGKPVAHFNTRIPESLSELLDDLVYKLKKKGEHKTKQELAHEALWDLLRKHSIC